MADADAWRDDALNWEERYATREAAVSGEPNPELERVASGLAPGAALDLGTGEGDDAIWLAARGWTVTAVDLSPTALDRGRALAERRGFAGRVTWLRADLRTWTPPARHFQLVTSHFVHFVPEERALAVARLADAVAPGGTLLLVGHEPSDLLTTARRPQRPNVLCSASEFAALLDPAAWTIAAEAHARQVRDPEGRPVTVHDAVLQAVRR